MSSNITNSVAFLRTTRDFPQETKELVVELNRAYVDTANAVNSRVIGIKTLNKSALNGEAWYFTGSNKQLGLTQVYKFDSTNDINHGIQVDRIFAFSPSCRGIYTDGTNSYGIIFANDQPVTNQISFYITPTSIKFNVDGSAPALQSGIIVLEWIADY